MSFFYDTDYVNWFIEFSAEETKGIGTWEGSATKSIFCVAGNWYWAKRK